MDSPGGPCAAVIFAVDGPGGPFSGGTSYGMTGPTNFQSDPQLGYEAKAEQIIPFKFLFFLTILRKLAY